MEFSDSPAITVNSSGVKKCDISISVSNAEDIVSEMKDVEIRNHFDDGINFTHFLCIQTSDTDEVFSAFVKLPFEHKILLDLECSNEDKYENGPRGIDQNIKAVMSKLDEMKGDDNFSVSICIVYRHFFDDIFWKVVKEGYRVVSPFLVVNSDQLEADTCRMKRFLYSTGMRNLVICFTEFRDKQKVEEMGRLVRALGGSCRAKMGVEITHLVAPTSSGVKVRFAQTYRIPVVSAEWIYAAWARRNEEEFLEPGIAADMAPNFLVRPFSGCKFSFFGFPDKELAEVVQLTLANGGKVAEGSSDSADSSVTHCVVFDGQPRAFLNGCNFPVGCEVVRVEWFWTCLQKQYLERIDHFRMNLSHLITSPSHPFSRVSSSGLDAIAGDENADTPPRNRRSGLISSKAQRRSRHAEFSDRLVQLATISSESLNSPMTSVIGRDSISYTSILDATGDSIGMESETTESGCLVSPTEVKLTTKTPDSTKKRRMTPRFGKTMELIHTESNYVGILDCMVSTIKKEILDPEQPGGPILNERDAEIVFRDLDPLLQVHTRLKEDLIQVANESLWQNDPRGEKIEIGTVMLRHLEEIERVYPPFVNFYDQRKETVESLSKKFGRFHAYLRRCQSRKETGRNSILELMIRPVQRLPSMMLILQDLLKHTDESLPDHKPLQAAVTNLKKVLSTINEDKRRTEGFLAVFNVVHAIDGCPADLASSHRQFLGQVDIVEVTSKLSDIGQPLTMFLFSDQLEICRRKRAANLSRNGSVRSNGDETPVAMSASTVSISSAVAACGNTLPTLPSTPSHNISSAAASSGKKLYKHVMLLALSEVECTTDLRKDVGSEDEFRAFALVMKKKAIDVPNEVYAFAVTDDTDKLQFLRTVAQQILITTCKNGTPDSLINEMGAGTFNIDIEEAFHRHTFSGKAKRLRQRVSRVLSFTRTPRRMKRAVSHLPASGLANADTASLASIEAPSTSDLRLAGTPMDTSSTPTRCQELGFTRSFAALTPTRSGELSLAPSRVSACALPFPSGESFRETRGVDPDTLFPASPPTPPELRQRAEPAGRPSLASRFHQRFSNFRRSISTAGAGRLSIVSSSSLDVAASEKKKRPRLSFFGSKSSSTATYGSSSSSSNGGGNGGPSGAQPTSTNTTAPALTYAAAAAAAATTGNHAKLYAVKEFQRSVEALGPTAAPSTDPMQVEGETLD